MSKDYQPRYLLYCAAKGNTPEQQAEKDRALYPGGYMCGYMLWVREQVQAFAAAGGKMLGGFVYDQKEFSEFLKGRVAA